MYLPNLENYREFPATSSCYLDGRYFNLVFRDYGGLIPNPLIVSVYETDKDTYMNMEMEPTNIDFNYTGLMRVIIKTSRSLHSALLIINHVNRIATLYDPLTHKHNELVRSLVESYLKIYLPTYRVELVSNSAASNIRTPYVTVSQHSTGNTSTRPENNPNCLVSGYCNAYVIKYAYDYLLGKPFDGRDIKQFAACVENFYGKLEGEPEIEYGDGNVFGGILLGSLGGAAIGGLVGGGRGVLPGMAIGGLTGGLLAAGR